MFNKEKPIAPLIGANGNIFNLLAIAIQTLQNNSLQANIDEMKSRVFASENYDEALSVIADYVEFGHVE